MKKIAFLFAFFISSFGFSQELMNFYLSPDAFSASTEGTVLMLHTTFYAYTGSGYINHNYTVENNEINFSLCYAVGSSQVITLEKRVFEIVIPDDIGEYTFNINLYTDYDGQNCAYENVTNTGTINFSLPYLPDETITITDVAFESYLEYLGFGDGVFANGLVYKNRIDNLISLYLHSSYFEMDGEVNSVYSIKEFNALKTLFCANFSLTEIDTSFNTELEFLYCDNNPLVNLDVTENLKLKKLWCRGIDLNQLDLSNNSLLEYLAFSSNQITTINLLDKPLLKDLELGGTQLTNLDLSNNLLLERVSINNTTIETLDLSNNSLLYYLNISENDLLTELNVSSLTNIRDMYCYGNMIETLDLSLNTNLSKAYLHFNNLTFLSIKNGNNEDIYEINTIMNTNLLCIEVDSTDENQPFDYNIDSQTQFMEDCSEPAPLLDTRQLNVTNVVVYPNPTNNILNITSQGRNVETIKIINLQGIIIKEVSNKTKIDVSELATGVYFIQIFSEGNSITKKFIKQ